MTIIHENHRLQEAILQAEHGHRVHPCHHITEAGGCSCGKCGPSQHGKHPALTGWQKAASTTEATLRQWWTDQPECNIGIATGPGSDLLIVDIDTRGKDGFKDLQELDPRGLGFDGIETPKARTGSGGGQLYFAWPKGCKLTTGAGIGGKAIDFRGIGGNAIAPGSANNLGQYEWIVSLDACDKAECPEWLLSFLSEDIAEGEAFRLCIWDTFQSVCLTADHKSNTEQKAIIQPLQAIADELGVAMICIEHHSRGGLIGKGNPDSAILGGGLTRTARVIWHVIEDPESPEKIRLFIPGKMNNCSKAEDLGWRFTFEDVERCIEGQQVTLPRVEWIEAAGVTIHEVQAKVNGEGGSGGDEKGQFAAAVEWLRDNLTEPTASATMEAGFKAEGFSKTTMRRAKEHLCIKSKRTTEGWLWMPSPKVSIGGEVIADPMAK